VTIEIVGERLPEIFLDSGRQHDVPAQHVARRKADDHAQRGGRPATGVKQRSERRPACRHDRSGVAGQRDRRRDNHDRLAVGRRGPPQRCGFPGKDQHRTHPAARQRGSWSRWHQRVELAHPPLPEAGEPEPARVLFHACPEGGQHPFTVGHRRASFRVD
jgi:hypothetical protein